MKHPYPPGTIIKGKKSGTTYKVIKYNIRYKEYECEVLVSGPRASYKMEMGSVAFVDREFAILQSLQSDGVQGNKEEDSKEITRIINMLGNSD